ncbi:MAG: histidine triad nucleotide-binding protein [Micavibrio sp.]|nr:histidine triad nucleotide-binding protein [Micavibrio sp.]|tara:strand:+ start:1147 stop:1515 length:369 start_codon:yes stop_codon:yes gene_type:complete
MSINYDIENIFAKILRGEVPCDKVYEDEHVLAFNDIAPHAPTHILVIPKGKYISADDFSINASAEEVTAFFRALGQIIKDHHLAQKGYRLIANTGEHGGQEVPHFHMHILAGEKIGPLRVKS